MLSGWYILYYHTDTLILPKGSCPGAESRWESRGEKWSNYYGTHARFIYYIVHGVMCVMNAITHLKDITHVRKFVT